MAKKVCEDCSYNTLKQLSKNLELNWNLAGYIKDAKKCGHKDCEKVFKEIQKNTQKNIALLKEVVTKKAKKGIL